MTRRKQMDQLFEDLLPSASQSQVESSRGKILGRVRADVAAGRQVRKATEPLSVALNNGDYHILLILEDGEQHGYTIMSRVEEVAEGATRFGPGTLYTSIRRLLKAGLIVEARTRPDHSLNEEPRRHYRMTAVGQKVLAAESERQAVRLRHSQEPQIVRCI